MAGSTEPVNRNPPGLGKKIGIAVLSLAGVTGVLEAVAAFRVHRQRTGRAYLGDRLYTEVRGEGDPIVLLAGLPATTRFWQGAFDPLAGGHRLIFVDALGFGRSPLPKVEYTLEDHLGALRRTLVAEGATRHITFIAHSFGTVLAAHYAARYPDEVDRLLLLGAPVFNDEREAREHIREMSSMSGLFILNPLLAREACKLHEATQSAALARLVEAFMPGTPPEVARERHAAHLAILRRQLAEHPLPPADRQTPMDDTGVLAPAAKAGVGASLYLKRHRICRGKQTIRITAPREPVRAGIDPWRKRIDRVGTDS